jgi:hypothetical protein
MSSSYKKSKRAKDTFESRLAEIGRWLSNQMLMDIRDSAFVAYFGGKNNAAVKAGLRNNRSELQIFRSIDFCLEEADRIAASKKAESPLRKSRCAAEKHAARIRKIVACRLKLGLDKAVEKGRIDEDTSKMLQDDFLAESPNLDFAIPESKERKPPARNPHRALEKALKILASSPLPSGVKAAEALKLHLDGIKNIPPPSLEDNSQA